MCSKESTNSFAFEERYKQLAMASTHGQRFFVTGGDHAWTDDVFKAFEYKERLEKIKSMKKETKHQQLMQNVESRALATRQLEDSTAASSTTFLWSGAEKSSDKEI